MPPDTKAMRLTAAEIAAVALAYNGATESPPADAIPDSVWEGLHERGLLTTTRDFTGEGTTVTTPAGTEALIEQIRVVSHGI